MKQLVYALLRAMAKRCPKDPYLVLFGARSGRGYMDCTQHLFEWINQHRQHYRPVWLTADPAIVQRIEALGFEACLQPSFKGFWLLARARLAVVSAQLVDLHPQYRMIPDTLQILFLGHGKSGKASTLASKVGRSASFHAMFARMRELLLAATATSPYIAQLSAEANQFPIEKYLITGYPRNDVIVEPPLPLIERWREFLDGLEPSHTVLYAPTWRQRGGPTQFFPFDDFERDRLLVFLESNRVLLLLRPHDREMRAYLEVEAFLHELAQSSDWIRLCDHGAISNVNHVLAFTDVLVSDYSSIYHDFLLVDRPIIFVPYDFDEFSETQGFMYDYYDLLPGPAVASFEAFLGALSEATAAPTTHRASRERLRALVHAQCDADATARVVATIDGLVERNM